MANSNNPKGLIPIKNNGGELDVNFYYVNSSYATALFIGDPVVKNGTSNIANVVAGQRQFNAGTLPEVEKATAGAGNPITGVIVGFLPNFDNTSRNYNPASTETIAVVADNPNQHFEIQEETAGTPLAATSVGLNANVVFAESGSTVTGISGVELDTTTPASGATLQLKILRLVDRVDNAIGQHAKWEVKINNHTDANAVAGI
jgi:hypothetical protein